MGLNLELQKLQNRIHAELRSRGVAQDYEDAFQDYVLRFLEGKRSQPLQHFCTDFLRRNNVKRQHLKYSRVDLKQEIIELIHSEDPTENVETKIDYNLIMEKIFEMGNGIYKRVLIFYFFSGLTFKEIGRRENLSEAQAFFLVKKAVRLLKFIIKP